MAETPGVILCGGRSLRMGGADKGFCEIGGRALLDHVIERLGPQVSALALNANGDPARFSRFALPVVADGAPGFPGPLAGVLAGMDWAAARGAARIVTAAWDTPFFPRDLARRLAAAAEEEGTPLAMAATREDGRLARHPVFGLWDVGLREDLRAALAAGVRKVVAWTGPIGCARAVFAAEPFDPFFNVNAPEDLETAARIWREHRP
jgi:molybdopterin-guanine dinucleotide biosynthesis protein A